MFKPVFATHCTMCRHTDGQAHSNSTALDLSCPSGMDKSAPGIVLHGNRCRQRCKAQETSHIAKSTTDREASHRHVRYNPTDTDATPAEGLPLSKSMTYTKRRRLESSLIRMQFRVNRSCSPSSVHSGCYRAATNTDIPWVSATPLRTESRLKLVHCRCIAHCQEHPCP